MNLLNRKKKSIKVLMNLTGEKSTVMKLLFQVTGKIMKEIVFSARAHLKLERLLDYLETEWSVKVKHSFIDKLDHALFQIAKMPESCPVSHKKRKVYISAS